MQLKAAIFDLDGTLLNSIDDLYITMNNVLTNSGYPPVSREQVRKNIGSGARDFMKLSLPEYAREEENIDKHLEIYHRAYSIYGYKNTAPYDGIIEVLKKLKENNIKISVLSNKPHRATMKVVERFFPQIEFDAVMGQKDIFPPKPDTQSALYMANLLGESPDSTAFFGDGETDVITAIEGGFFQVAVLWGYRTKEELQICGAKNFIQTPQEILKIFNIK